MEPKRAIYRQGGPYSPFQNQNPTNTIGRKKYTISAPPPGVKPDDFQGIASLSNRKRVTLNPTRIMLKDLPVLLQSRHDSRKIIKIVPRILISDSTSASVSVQDNIGATQEVRTEASDEGATHPEKRKKPLSSQHPRPKLIKVAPRIVVPDSTSTSSSVQDNIEDEQEASSEASEDVLTPREKRRSSYGVSCSECKQILHTRQQLCYHASSVHGIRAPVVTKVFDTEDLFKTWINLIKRTHAVDFVNSSGARSCGGGEQKITYLQCSQSGNPKTFIRPDSQRKSKKCGKTCLAYLKITQSLRNGDPYGPFQVEGCLQHSGHTIHPERILLITEEKLAVRQLNELVPTGPVNITLARAIFKPCARIRLITDEHLLEILPKWMWTVRNERLDVSLNAFQREKDDEEKRLLDQASGIQGDTFDGGIDLQNPNLECDDTDEFINVDDI